MNCNVYVVLLWWTEVNSGECDPKNNETWLTLGWQSIGLNYPRRIG